MQASTPDHVQGEQQKNKYLVLVIFFSNTFKKNFHHYHSHAFTCIIPGCGRDRQQYPSKSPLPSPGLSLPTARYAPSCSSREYCSPFLTDSHRIVLVHGIKCSRKLVSSEKRKYSYRANLKPVAPVAYQVNFEPGIGQFREFEPRRVHTRINSLGLFPVDKLTCGKRESVS